MTFLGQRYTPVETAGNATVFAPSSSATRSGSRQQDASNTSSPPEA